MRRKLYLSAAVIVLLAACGKDNFETKPQIKVKSLNGNVLHLGGTLAISLTFTDKEGDISKGRFVYFPVRLNKRPLPSNITPYIDSIPYALPEFPDKSQGEIQLTLQYNDLHKSPIENDTIRLRFVAIDRAGHKSDTIATDKIVILKN